MALSACNTKTDPQGRELIEHGTALFPVACYHDNLAVEEVPWHWHEALEVAVVTEGRSVMAAGTEKYVLSKGDAFFINGGVLHAMWDADNSRSRYHSVVFHPRLVGGSVDSIFWQDYIQPLLDTPSLKSVIFDSTAPWHQEAADAIETAWQSCVAELPGYEFSVRAALSQLIFLLSSHHPVPRSLPSEKALRDGERIKIMLQYIQEHYSVELTTAMIAGSAMISESECLRCFHNTIGTPPIKYVKQFRIQEAARLLAATNQKIADIGAQCGFPDTSYFTRTFREMKDCTPGEYRKQFINLQAQSSAPLPSLLPPR